MSGWPSSGRPPSGRRNPPRSKRVDVTDDDETPTPKKRARVTRSDPTAPRAPRSMEWHDATWDVDPDGALCLTLPVPPSTNRIWRGAKGGHNYKTPAAKQYCEQANNRLRGVTMIAKPHEVSVTFVWWRPPDVAGDLDNITKTLLDALKGRAFTDDSQVTKLVQDIEHDAERAPRVEVIIERRPPRVARRMVVTRGL